MIDYEKIDVECRELVRALNQVPGCKTIESCHGHGKEKFLIWLEFDSISSVNYFAWAGCHRWFNISTFPEDRWTLQFDNGDTDCFSKALRFVLVGPNDVLLEECNSLAKCISNWLVEEGHL